MEQDERNQYICWQAFSWHLLTDRSYKILSKNPATHHPACGLLATEATINQTPIYNQGNRVSAASAVERGRENDEAMGWPSRSQPTGALGRKDEGNGGPAYGKLMAFTCGRYPKSIS
jgi:hypothetical protein